jgi:hypothetical protein
MKTVGGYACAAGWADSGGGMLCGTGRGHGVQVPHTGSSSGRHCDSGWERPHIHGAFTQQRSVLLADFPRYDPLAVLTGIMLVVTFRKDGEMENVIMSVATSQQLSGTVNSARL